MSPLASAIAARTSSRPAPGSLSRDPQQVDGEGAGDLAGSVAAHPVGHGEHVRRGEQVVLVVGTDPTGIGRRAPSQGHHY